MTELAVGKGSIGVRDNRNKSNQVRAKLAKLSFELTHESVCRGSNANLLQKVTKSASFFYLAVSIIMTLTYSCEVGEYLAAGRIALRNLCSCALLLYRVVFKYVTARKASLEVY